MRANQGRIKDALHIPRKALSVLFYSQSHLIDLPCWIHKPLFYRLVPSLLSYVLCRVSESILNDRKGASLHPREIHDARRRGVSSPAGRQGALHLQLCLDVVGCLCCRAASLHQVGIQDRSRMGRCSDLVRCCAGSKHPLFDDLLLTRFTASRSRHADHPGSLYCGHKYVQLVGNRLTIYFRATHGCRISSDRSGREYWRHSPSISRDHRD